MTLRTARLNGFPLVREAQLGEATIVLRILERSFLEYQGRLDPPSGVFSETAESLGEQIANRQVLVCEAGGELIGCAYVKAEASFLYIGRFGVVPEWRNAGVGGMLLHTAESRARSAGYDRVRLNVRIGLDGLRRYYESRGYAAVEYLTHEGYPGPTYVQMEKCLMNEESNESMRLEFDLEEAIAVLERTPGVLSSLLGELPDAIVRATEGPGTWSPFDVVGHLIHGERTDWIPRARHILNGRPEPFESFDRNAQFAASASRTLSDLLVEFTELRRDSIESLRTMHLGKSDLELVGNHPELGVVTLGQLLATWVVHDLDHIGQVGRTIAKRYTNDVGPWSAYLSILRDRT